MTLCFGIIWWFIFSGIHEAGKDHEEREKRKFAEKKKVWRKNCWFMFGPFLGPSSDKNNSDESQERTKTCPAITSVKECLTSWEQMSKHTIRMTKKTYFNCRTTKRVGGGRV